MVRPSEGPHREIPNAINPNRLSARERLAELCSCWRSA